MYSSGYADGSAVRVVTPLRYFVSTKARGQGSPLWSSNGSYGKVGLDLTHVSGFTFF